VKIRSRFLTRCVAFCCMTASRAIFATCRIEAIEHTPGTSPYADDKTDSPERFLFCIWHDILMMAIFCGKPRHMAGLVSRHQDGSYLADTMRMVGLTPIRGSSQRGGTQAIKQCLEAAKAHHISITPDGPRGPRHELKEGIVFLASQSGRRIVPVTARCKRYWRFQAKWTDMLIPKPFTRVLIVTGEPICIPSGLSREQIKEQAKRVEQIMHELEDQIDRQMHPERYSQEVNEAYPNSKAA